MGKREPRRCLNRFAAAKRHSYSAIRHSVQLGTDGQPYELAEFSQGRGRGIGSDPISFSASKHRLDPLDQQGVPACPAWLAPIAQLADRSVVLAVRHHAEGNRSLGVRQRSCGAGGGGAREHRVSAGCQHPSRHARLGDAPRLWGESRDRNGAGQGVRGRWQPVKPLGDPDRRQSASRKPHRHHRRELERVRGTALAQAVER